MFKTSENITNADIMNYANKVKSIFDSPPANRWHKGKLLASYNDAENGYKLQLLCNDIDEAKKMITNTLKIQNDVPDWKKLTANTNLEPADAFPVIPKKTTILGKSRQLPRKRPTAYADFQYAVLHIWGLPHPVVLYDPHWCFGNALLR